MLWHTAWGTRQQKKKHTGRQVHSDTIYNGNIPLLPNEWGAVRQHVKKHHVSKQYFGQYWFGQKLCSGFSVSCYGIRDKKIQPTVEGKAEGKGMWTAQEQLYSRRVTGASLLCFACFLHMCLWVGGWGALLIFSFKANDKSAGCQQ